MGLVGFVFCLVYVGFVEYYVFVVVLGVYFVVDEDVVVVRIGCD